MIYCFHTALHPKAEESFDSFAPDIRYINTSAGPTLYAEIFNHLWKTTEGNLITLEHDIEIHAGVVESFEECPEPWCIYSYEGPPRLGYLSRALGCTKFSEALRREVALDVGNRHWTQLDSTVALILALHGYRRAHLHGVVKHHHYYPQG
jgi:hypothetical protein